MWRKSEIVTWHDQRLNLDWWHIARRQVPIKRRHARKFRPQRHEKEKRLGFCDWSLIVTKVNTMVSNIFD